MAIDTIKSTAVLDGAIATADIADDAVTNAKIGAGAVGTTEVADDAITGAKIENNPTIAGNLGIGGITTSTGTIVASAGVAVGGTGAANTLDDYEEGGWTPNLIGSTSNPSTAVTGSGTYSKVGRLIYANYSFSNNDVAGASGGIRVNGLPFANAGGHISGNVMVYYRKSAFSDSINLSPYYASNILYFYQTRNGSGEPWSEILFDTTGGSTGFYLWGSIVYETAT